VDATGRRPCPELRGQPLHRPDGQSCERCVEVAFGARTGGLAVGYAVELGQPARPIGVRCREVGKHAVGDGLLRRIHPVETRAGKQPTRRVVVAANARDAGEREARGLGPVSVGVLAQDPLEPLLGRLAVSLAELDGCELLADVVGKRAVGVGFEEGFELALRGLGILRQRAQRFVVFAPLHRRRDPGVLRRLTGECEQHAGHRSRAHPSPVDRVCHSPIPPARRPGPSSATAQSNRSRSLSMKLVVAGDTSVPLASANSSSSSR